MVTRNPRACFDILEKYQLKRFIPVVRGKYAKKKLYRNPAVVTDFIAAYFQKKNWRYEYDQNNRVFKSGITLDCKLSFVRFILETRDDLVVNRAVVPIAADEEKRADISEFLGRANYGTIRGAFEMDLSDGEIGFRLAASFAEFQDDAEETMRVLTYLPCQMFEQYGNGLLDVLFDRATPKEAVENARR